MKTKSTKIAFINGYSFGPVARLVLVLIGVLPMIVLLADVRSSSFGLIFLIFPILAYTSQFGTEFSEDLKRVRQFSLLLGFKKGAWINLKIYSDFVIIKLSRKWGMSSRSGRSVQFDDSKHEIYLMTSDHRHRILVKVCQSKADAVDTALILSERLNRKLIEFNPRISEKSKQTKRRGLW